MKNKLTKSVIITVFAMIAIISIVGFTNSKSATKGYKYLQVTTIESVVPGGMGRSRMITVDETGKTEEIKMENFFSMAGINFDNVRFNDKIITDKIETLSNQGWELVQATPGVYAADKSTGIFITRYLFKKQQ